MGYSLRWYEGPAQFAGQRRQADPEGRWFASHGKAHDHHMAICPSSVVACMHACIVISLVNFFFSFFFLDGLTLLSLLRMAMLQCAVVACGTMTDKTYANASSSQVLRDQPILPAQTVFAGTDCLCW